MGVKFEKIPTDVVQYIISFLDFKRQTTNSRVNKRWKQVWNIKYS